MAAHRPEPPFRHPRSDTARSGYSLTEMDVLVAAVAITLLIQPYLTELYAILDHWRAARF